MTMMLRSLRTAKKVFNVLSLWKGSAYRALAPLCRAQAAESRGDLHGAAIHYDRAYFEHWFSRDELPSWAAAARFLVRALYLFEPTTAPMTLISGLGTTAATALLNASCDANLLLDAPMSFTSNPQIARGFAAYVDGEQIALEIEFPAGTRGLFLGKLFEFDHEAEFLLPPGSRLELTTESREAHGMLLIKARLVGQQLPKWAQIARLR